MTSKAKLDVIREDLERATAEISRCQELAEITPFAKDREYFENLRFYHIGRRDVLECMLRFLQM